MFTIDVHGWQRLGIDYCVIDLNGTLSQAGVISSGAKDRMERLASVVSPIVLTADTRGIARSLLKGFPVDIHILVSSKETEEKEAYVRSLGAERVAYIGNGANDELAMQAAALGICIVGTEGCFSRTALGADVLVPSIHEALDLFLFPERLLATLRR
jgi:soluble P-type ATPase